MSKKTDIIKPVSTIAGFALASTLAFGGNAIAADTDFELADLDQGYMVAGDEKDKEGKCGEGKCGDKEGKDKDGKCGEGKCGDKEGKDKDGKCGEGKCGDKKEKGEEGSCGA